jgi:hypothetical protein
VTQPSCGSDIGSELRWNWLPDEIGNEDTYFSWELIHVVISF